MVYLSIVAFAIGRFGCGSTDTQLGHSRWHQFRWTSRSGNVASCVAARFSLGKSLHAETSRWPSRDAAYIICDRGLQRGSLADFPLLSLLVRSEVVRF
jgi:hypothetical protein